VGFGAGFGAGSGVRGRFRGLGVPGSRASGCLGVRGALALCGPWRDAGRHSGGNGAGPGSGMVHTGNGGPSRPSRPSEHVAEQAELAELAELAEQTERRERAEHGGRAPGRADRARAPGRVGQGGVTVPRTDCATARRGT